MKKLYARCDGFVDEQEAKASNVDAVYLAADVDDFLVRLLFVLALQRSGCACYIPELEGLIKEAASTVNLGVAT